MVDIEPILHVNQSVWTPDFSFCQILAVRPPQHQRGLSSSHNTPSVCSPVVPVRQVLPSPSSACLLEFDNTCVSVRLSPDFFQFRNVVPACYRSTKSLVFVHIRQDQILSLLFCESHFFFFLCFHARFASYPHCRRCSAQQGCAAAAQSAVTQSCK